MMQPGLAKVAAHDDNMGLVEYGRNPEDRAKKAKERHVKATHEKNPHVNTIEDNR